MNIKKLKEKMEQCRLTEREAAVLLGMEPGACARRLSGTRGSFTVRQAKRLSEHLGLSAEEADEIFLR